MNIKLVYPGDDSYRDACESYELTCDEEVRLAVYENDNGLAVYTYYDNNCLWNDGYLLCTWEALPVADAVSNNSTTQDEAIYELLFDEAKDLGFPEVLNSKVMYGVDLMEGVDAKTFESINKVLPYTGVINQVVYGTLDDDDWHESNVPSIVFSYDMTALSFIMEQGRNEHVRLYEDTYSEGMCEHGDTAMVYPPHTYGNCDSRWLYEGFSGYMYELHPNGAISPWLYTWHMLVGNKLNDRIPYDILEYLKSRGY